MSRKSNILGKTREVALIELRNKYPSPSEDMEAHCYVTLQMMDYTRRQMEKEFGHLLTDAQLDEELNRYIGNMTYLDENEIDEHNE